MYKKAKDYRYLASVSEKKSLSQIFANFFKKNSSNLEKSLNKQNRKKILYSKKSETSKKFNNQDQEKIKSRKASLYNFNEQETKNTDLPKFLTYQFYLSFIKNGAVFVFTAFLGLILKLYWIIINFFDNLFKRMFTGTASRLNFVSTVFFVFVLAIVIRFGYLQVSVYENVAGDFSFALEDQIEATRGKIYVKNLAQGNQVLVAGSESLYNLFIDPSVLQKTIETGLITKDQAVQIIASTMNISASTLDLEITSVLEETKIANEKVLNGADKSIVPKYKAIKKLISRQQKEAVDQLRIASATDKDSPYFKFNIQNWLNTEPNQVRVYPYGKFLSNTIGFTTKTKVTGEEAKKIPSCRDMVNQNELRGTALQNQYNISYYGLEEKYCSILAGLNGRRIINNQENKAGSNTDVQNGANLYLTIDQNLQTKAEDTLFQLIRDNTNTKGAPKDGAIIIMEADTGKILAMASYPNFDPGRFEEARAADFRNAATNSDYEIGSVAKPLTVAMALNEGLIGSVDSNTGKTLGVSPDWTFQDYVDGKPYQENNGDTKYIRNAQNFSYFSRGRQSLSNILRDSINTGIAELQPTVGNRKMREYFLEKFMFGKSTLISLPGDALGLTNVFSESLNSEITYASLAFGQGFTATLLQLVRSYTPLANNGDLVEPILVEKLEWSDGTVDTYNTPSSPIQQPSPIKMLSPKTTEYVNQYMVNTLDQGYLGQKPSKGQVPGYTVAGKTGTSQIARSYNGSPCDYTCNTNLGLYDHTFIGYGPATPNATKRYIVAIKLTEPKPGEKSNFAENTIGPGFSQLMGYTLNYMGVPKDR